MRIEEAAEYIHKLEQRMLALEVTLESVLGGQNAKTQAQQEVIAPFFVVSTEGRILCEISGDDRISVFRLFNTSGKVAVSLASNGEDNGEFALRNNKGELVAYLNVEQNSTRLLLQNEEGESAIAMFAENDKESGGGINIIACKSDAFISLWANAKGGEVKVYNADDKVIGQLPSS